MRRQQPTIPEALRQTPGTANVSMMRLYAHAAAPRGPIDRIEDELCVSSLA